MKSEIAEISSITAAQEALEKAERDLSNAKDLQPEENWCVENAKGVPESLSESYWIKQIAALRTLLFDPVCGQFFAFQNGLWSVRTKPEVINIVGSYIRSEMGADFGPILDKVAKLKAIDPIVVGLSGHPCVVRRDAFANPPRGIILLKNGRLEVKKDGSREFTEGDQGRPEDYQTYRLPVSYNTKASVAKTSAWLNRIFKHREDDVQAIAKAMGVCLWGSNRWKKMVVLHGGANLGKSQLPLIMGMLCGGSKVVSIEGKRMGEKFEAKRFVGKILLTAEDVESDFMTRSYAEAWKQLTGFGKLRVEGKNSSEDFELRGDKLIFATTNFEKLRVRADVDASAWEERLVYVHADGEPYRREEQDTELLENLFADEGEASGILNFALGGLEELLANGWERSEIQMERVREVMDQSTHVEKFARLALEIGDHPERPGVTVNELWAAYMRYTEAKKVVAWPERIGKEMLIEAVEKAFGKTTSNSIDRGTSSQRGWRGMKLESIREEAQQD